MHGFAIHLLMGKWKRQMVAEMANRKSIEMIKIVDARCRNRNFQTFENLSMREKIMLSIYGRYQKIFLLEQMSAEKTPSREMHNSGRIDRIDSTFSKLT